MLTWMDRSEVNGEGELRYIDACSLHSQTHLLGCYLSLDIAYLTSVYTHAVFRTLDSINSRSAAKGESVFVLI